jgi:hypothetical protein
VGSVDAAASAGPELGPEHIRAEGRWSWLRLSRRVQPGEEAGETEVGWGLSRDRTAAFRAGGGHGSTLQLPSEDGGGEFAGRRRSGTWKIIEKGEEKRALAAADDGPQRWWKVGRSSLGRLGQGLDQTVPGGVAQGRGSGGVGEFEVSGLKFEAAPSPRVVDEGARTRRDGGLGGGGIEYEYRPAG